MIKKFLSELSREIEASKIKSLTLEHWVLEYGNKPKHPKSKVNRFKLRIRNLFYKFKPVYQVYFLFQLLAKVGKIYGFYYCYSILDEKVGNKGLYLKVVSFRLLGHRFVKLPLDTEQFWKGLSELDRGKARYNDKLYEYDLGQEGVVVGNSKSVFNQFVVKQYSINSDQLDFSARTGDYCFDVGACWGETSVFFGNRVGKKGRVYAFEFDGANLSILNDVIERNSLSEVVTVFPSPLLDNNGEPVYSEGEGSGSRVVLSESEKPNTILSRTLDQVVLENKINKMDLLKLDVEGSECRVIKGAENSIKQFRPVVIAALYHRDVDFLQVAKLLKKLASSYVFVFDHYTTYHEESFLFAIPSERIAIYLK
jgi:FkbM family methyltransferase